MSKKADVKTLNFSDIESFGQNNILLKFRYHHNTENMSRIISINEQGTITLPQDLIKKYGLKAGGKVVIEESEAGLILRPKATFPVEIYSDERVEEFQQLNEDELKEFKL